MLYLLTFDFHPYVDLNENEEPVEAPAPEQAADLELPF